MTTMTKVREQFGISINELARRIGVPYPTVRIIDRGEGLGFSPVVKLKIAAALGVEPLALFPELRELIDHVSGAGYIVTKKPPAGKVRGRAKVKP